MLGNSITKFFKLDNLITNLTGYVETKVELIKVELKEDLTKGLAQTLIYILIAFVFALVILLLSLGVAIVLTEKFGSFWGYAIVAAFYCVVGILLLVNRVTLIQKFEKFLSQTFRKK